MDDVIGFVLKGDQRCPPRQLFERALGVSRTEFISHTAIRRLRRLGFPTSPLLALGRS